MTIENTIKEVISTKLSDGTVEKLVSAELEKGVKSALENLFRSYGDVTKVIEGKIKEVMVPYLESYDYSEYITKLDSVLVDVLKSAALENKVLLKNFKDLMSVEEKMKKIKVTELFEKWKKYVADNVDTDDLEVVCDDEPTYESVEVSFEFEIEEEKRSWMSSSSIYEYATLLFECEHDVEMNLSLRLYRWKSDESKAWSIEYKTNYDLHSLRNLNEMDILLMKMAQNHTKILIDDEHGSDDVEPEKEPEVSFS